MPTISYTIADRFFASQKELVAYVSALLRSAHPPMRLTGDDAAFMGDLLLRHPSADRKIGCGVAAIWIKRNCHDNPYAVFGNGFYVERTDGTFIDFSYKQCIRPFTHATKAKFAFRRAIDDQTLAVKKVAFRDSEVLICPVTDEPITWETAHVDHEPPLTFAALLADYCGERGIDLNTIELYEPRSGIGKLLPPDIEMDWADWHRARACLRVISADANVRLVR